MSATNVSSTTAVVCAGGVSHASCLSVGTAPLSASTDVMVFASFASVVDDSSSVLSRGGAARGAGSGTAPCVGSNMGGIDTTR